MFISPWFLLLGLLALPVILLYMLRLRRREVVVSSTMLWRKLMRDREANAPWQKLRKNLLLFLQLLILALLVFALARPFFPVATVANGNIVVLLDGSASMLATDVDGGTRFEAAKVEAEKLIANLGGDDRMSIVSVAGTPTVLLSNSNDRKALRAALATAAVEVGEPNWDAAFALASGIAQGYSDPKVVIVSDGGLPEKLIPISAETIYLPIGSSGENLGITALASRRTEAGNQLFVAVQNFGTADQSALLSLSVDGALNDSRRLDVPAGGRSSLSFALPEDVQTIEAVLSDMAEDYLAADNRAWAVHDGGARREVLLQSEGNLFLEQIFGALPGMELVKAAPFTPIEADYDLLVFDGASLPAELPASDMLIINPEGSNPLFTVTGTFENTSLTRLVDSPLLQFVEWNGIHVRQGRTLESTILTPLVSAEGGSLLLTGQYNGHRVAVLTFDLHDSDLPLQIAFPILMANLTEWLNPGSAIGVSTVLQPNDPVPLSIGGSASDVQVVKPDGDVWSREIAEASLTFAETGQLGLYQVRLIDREGGRDAGSFAINLFQITESNIAPAQKLNILGVVDASSGAAEQAERKIGQRELWQWLAVFAFLFLLVEWWVHFRGARLPRLPFLRKS